MGKTPNGRTTWRAQWALFHEALEVDPDERSEFLRRSAPSADVREAVENLLRAHEIADGPLEQSPMSGVAGPPDAEDATLIGQARALQPGQILARRFEIIRSLGQGGMGAVYEAWDPELETPLAVKILRPDIAASEKALRRFRREIQLARQVTHPNVCRVFDLYRDGNLDFLTMELVDGETLDERIRRDGPLTPSTAAPLVGQICSGLSAAHEVGVLHRDLKPANIMLVGEGDTTRAVVMDFGLARSVHSEDEGGAGLTATGQTLGTPAYMAPEQIEGRVAGPATDVYALGVILFELVTGRQPFQGETPYSILAKRMGTEAPSPRRFTGDLDPIWERAILRCLQRRPEDRFESIEELRNALHGKGQGSPQRGISNRLVLILGTVVVVLALIATLVWRGHDPKPQQAVGPAPASEAVLPTRLILITDFENKTGEEELSGVLDTALARELSSSSIVSVTPRQRIADTLHLMGRPSDTRIDPGLGLEIALRDGEVEAVLAGKIERLGAIYLLGAELLRPEGGESVASLSEEAEGLEGVLPAIRRLAESVLETVGRGLPVSEANLELPPVSTPSLAALKLYAEANQLFIEEMVSGPDRNQAAERLLLAAIAEDPDFASAHLHLAFAILRQGRPLEEVLPHAERALELSDTATPVERAFIRGAHYSFLDRLGGADALNYRQQAAAEYQALLEIEPTHTWANHNIIRLLNLLDRGFDATDAAVHAAENLPGNPWLAQTAASMIMRYRGDVDAARRHLERARGSSDGTPLESPFWTKILDLHELWLEGNLEEVVSGIEDLLDRIDSFTPEQRGELYGDVRSLYLDLGMYRRAVEFETLFGDGDTSDFDHLLAWRRLDFETLREILPREPSGNPRTDSNNAVSLAQVGLLPQAEALLATLPDQPDPVTRGNSLSSRASIALARGENEEVVSLLTDGLELLRSQFVLARYFRSTIDLSQAWEALDYPERGARVLETAAGQRGRLLHGGRFYWMLAELRRAELYRRLGRKADADRIEATLWNLCSFADPDFPILRELEIRRPPVPVG